MSDDDPFMIVKPDNENKRMSSYLKKNERGSRKKDVETSSNGSVSTRSTATSTAQDDTTMFSAGKTPESKSKGSTGGAFGAFDDTSAIAFNSDFGNGLEFGGFGGGGDDGFGTAPQPSNSKKKTNNSFDAFDPEAFGESFGSKGFEESFTDSEGFGAFNGRKEPVNFGNDGFNAAFGEDSRSQQQQHQSSSKDDAWKKREAWKNQNRSTSSSSGSGNRRGGGHRRAPSRTASKGDITGIDNGSGHGHSDDNSPTPRAPRSERLLGSRGERRPDDNPRAPRSERHMMSRGEGNTDDNPRAPRSERHMMSRGEGNTDDNPRAPRSERHMMSRVEGNTDDNPRAPRSERHMMSRGEGSTDDNPRAPRSDRHMMSRGEGNTDDNPRAPRSDRHMMSRGEGHADDSPRARSDRSPVRRTKSGSGLGPSPVPRQRRVAEGPPQRGPPSEPERSNGRRPQRSGRRASLAMPSKSEGNMEFAPRSAAPPQRNKSIDGIMEAPNMDHLSGGRLRTRRRGSVGILENPASSNPMQTNSPHTGPPKGAPKEFLRDRSDNQQKIMDMYKGGALAGDQKPERLDVSIDTVPDASLGNGNHEGGGGGGLGLGKIFGGKSKKAEKLGDNSDHGSGSAGGFVIPDHEPPKRAPRRGSLAFTRRKAEEPKEADYTENRNMEGRSRATLLERVAAAGDKPS